VHKQIIGIVSGTGRVLATQLKGWTEESQFAVCIPVFPESDGAHDVPGVGSVRSPRLAGERDSIALPKADRLPCEAGLTTDDIFAVCQGRAENTDDEK